MADTQKQLYCPACGSVMNKYFIHSAGIYVDICDKGCGGLWFDNEEEKHFDEPHENIKEILDVIDGKEFKEVNQAFNRMCPVCGSKMQKIYTSPKRLVQVDSCHKCGGKFFDLGELRAMREEYTTEADRNRATRAYLDEKFSGISSESRVDLSKMNWIDKILYLFGG